MRRMLSGLAGLALGTIASTSVQAQACQGLNSPSNFQLSAGITSGAKEFGAAVMFGKSTGVFAGVGGEYTKFNGEGAGNSKGGIGTVGYQVGVGEAKKLALCPVVTLGIFSGSVFEGTGGLSIGIPVSSSGSKMKFIPTAAVALVYDHFKSTGTCTGCGSNSTTSGKFSGGVGFIFSPSFALRPMVSIGTETGSSAFFSVTASIGFGKS